MSREVLLAGSWDEGPGYPRTRSLRAALADLGCAVRECRTGSPLGGARKRELVRRPWRWPDTVLRTWSRGWSFRRRLREAVGRHRPELVVVPYPGHLLVPAVRRAVDVPVVLDLFLSVHDTVVADRRWLHPGSLGARALRALDRRACAAADLVLLDTPEHAEAVAELVGLDRDRFAAFPVGDPEAPPAPAAVPALEGGPLEVLFFGTGVPLHGLETLIDALGLARGVRLTLIGGTPGDRERAAALPPERLRLLPPFVDRATLQAELARCHVVAGVFGTSAKAGRVVPFKVVHGLAAGRMVVTARTPAVRRVLGEGEVVTVPAGDAGALAEALGRSRHDAVLKEHGRAARAAFEREFSVAALSRRLGSALAPVWRPRSGNPVPVTAAEAAP